MIRRLDEGILEDIELLAGISPHVSSENGKFMPYVRICRKDGSDVHVHYDPLDTKAEALKFAKDKADAMIQVATASDSSGS